MASIKRVFVPETFRILLHSVYHALKPASHLPDERYAYQRLIIRHEFKPGETVLDVGSGGDPFPYATVLVDRFLAPTHHRHAQFKTENKPVIVSDIGALPFRKYQFDYAVCAHVLEHVDDPVRACLELQRVARSGFIETPTLMKDTLFSWAKGMHKWHLTAMKDHLFFFEYDERRLEGIRSSFFRHLILEQPTYHPLQDIFNKNQDIFNTTLEWEGQFNVTVARLDGTLETTYGKQVQVT